MPCLRAQPFILDSGKGGYLSHWWWLDFEIGLMICDHFHNYMNFQCDQLGQSESNLYRQLSWYCIAHIFWFMYFKKRVRSEFLVKTLRGLLVCIFRGCPSFFGSDGRPYLGVKRRFKRCARYRPTALNCIDFLYFCYAIYFAKLCSAIISMYREAYVVTDQFMVSDYRWRWACTSGITYVMLHFESLMMLP